jgi:bacterial/archaeal transporter family-2 protein
LTLTSQRWERASRPRDSNILCPVSPISSATIAALIAGTAAALQATLLGILGRRAGVLAATTIAAVVGAVLILAVTVVTDREGMAEGLRQPAWWWLVVGALGIAVLTILTYAPPRIGTFGTFALLIGGQLTASILIDSMGLFGVDRVPLAATRVVGLVLVLAGAALVLRK